MKWALIRAKKPSAIAAAVPTVIAFVAVMTVLVTVIDWRIYHVAWVENL